MAPQFTKLPITYLAIVLFLVLVGLVSVLLWRSSEQNISSFGLNALTEVLGIAVTVFIVDQLLRRRESARLLPQRAAAYEDVRFLTTHIVGFWRDAFERAVSGDYPESAEALFVKEQLARLSKSLDMDSHPNVIPKRTWWEWIPSETARHKVLAEKILERHSQILSPVAYRAVHRIVTGYQAGEYLTNQREVDAKLGIPRPRNLSALWVWNDSYVDAIRKLLSWCATELKEIREAGERNVFQVDDRAPFPHEALPPVCQMLPEKYAAQVMAYLEWQSRTKELNLERLG